MSIFNNKIPYGLNGLKDWVENRDCFSIPLNAGDKLYFTSPVGGDTHYFYPYTKA